MKKILSLILFCLIVNNISATDSPFHNTESKLMEHAKEFFHDKNYSAAYRYTEARLSKLANEMPNPMSCSEQRRIHKELQLQEQDQLQGTNHQGIVVLRYQ